MKNAAAKIKTVATSPFKDQRPGTSGLRKRTRVFMQPNYVENFIQSVFDAVREAYDVDFASGTLIVGGDGRYHNRAAIQTIIRMAAANGFQRVFVGRGGILSTPAMSAAIRRHGALGGILLTASHNPGGIDADFGIKYNIHNGGPAPEQVTEKIFTKSLEISQYRILDSPEQDLEAETPARAGSTEVRILDPFEDYTAVMRELFDFEALRKMFAGGFRLLFDAMHGVTGPYAHHIFERLLGAPAGTVIHGTPLEDFGGLHPDPNLAHAVDLVAAMSQADASDLGAACDGDGDRNMILGRRFFVTPGDSLAIIAEYAAKTIPGYRSGLKGIARSMPTSTAADRVAQSLGLSCYETPTGWKYFGNLMDAGMCTICGEESFGTGSSHVREKDGLWAVLCWLSIIGDSRRPVADIVSDHWSRFGRSYYQRHDYEGLDSGSAKAMISGLGSRLAALSGKKIAFLNVTVADDFSYRDPVDGSVTEHQGLRILLEDGSRLIFRLSGTGTEGATLRLYLERFLADGSRNIEEVLKPLSEAAVDLLRIKECCGRDHPTLIT